MKYPVFKAILKCKNHPSILQIRKVQGNSIFYFTEDPSKKYQRI